MIGGFQDSVGNLQRFLAPYAGQERFELVAADARNQILASQNVPQHAGKRFEHAVACVMAVSIVDALELVQIHHQHRDRLAQKNRFKQLLGKCFRKTLPVHQPSQVVRFRLRLQSQFLHSQVGYIPHNRNRADLRSRMILEGVNADMDKADFAAGQAQFQFTGGVLFCQFNPFGKADKNIAHLRAGELFLNAETGT